MPLLWDHNLSPRLTARLEDLDPDGVHVAQLGLDDASDQEIWGHAELHGLTLASKDRDFNDMVALRGAPPRLVWLKLGNCTTDQVEDAVRQRWEAIDEFMAGEGDVLILV